VDGPVIDNANDDKIEYNNSNDDIITVANINQGGAPHNDIIAVANINQGGAPQLQPIVKINNTDKDSNNNNDKNKNNTTTGVHRSKCNNKGKTERFSDYGLFMAERRRAKAGLHQATIRDSTMFFSAVDLSQANPVPVKD
jgi:hypothetical protein